MKKLISKLAGAPCAATLLLTVCLFAGCGAKEVTYTITLKTPEGTYDSTISDELMIGFCEGEDGNCRMFYLDENGVCTIKASDVKGEIEYKGDYVVKILRNGVDSNPRYKTYNETHKVYEISAKNNNIEIELEPKDAA